MTALTLLLLRVAFLVLLWVFIFIVVYSLRSDLFGSRITRLQQGTPAPTPSPSPAPTTPARASAPVASPDAATTVTNMGRGSRSASAPTAAARPASRLVVTGGPRAGLEMDLPATGLTIGRSSGSGLQVKDDYTSSNHARLVLRGDEWRIEDLGSTNGTFVAGRRVQGSAVAASGVELRIGTTTFELRR
ncbi:FHA domain-containing protein FhaB/FipA [Agrococcus jejuensis]|uniref:FHA domain-containing protein n=1 Tax=Agrococcus jejuensis TaxID=399736 RepID=A0A1G8DHE1_9MICO|nr:FHA domain-containing protein [Agrococcus jejuensis]SDH56730.1 FHA domain-containing protein [Agrococcus jejuensis]